MEWQSWFSAGSLWRKGLKYLLVHVSVGGLLLPSCLSPSCSSCLVGENGIFLCREPCTQPRAERGLPKGDFSLPLLAFHLPLKTQCWEPAFCVKGKASLWNLDHVRTASAWAAAPGSKGWEGDPPRVGPGSTCAQTELEQLAVTLWCKPGLGHSSAPVALPGQVAAAGRGSRRHRQQGFPGKLAVLFALLLGQNRPG